MAKKPAFPEAPAAAFGSTFGDLLRARGMAVAPAPLAGPAEPATAPAAVDLLDLRAVVGKVVVRREKAGRGGKTVTLVTGLPSESLDALARALKTALGCGAVVEEADIVLQGDQTGRTMTWLSARGARNVVRGN